MTDRIYRGLLGAVILIALYVELNWLMFVVIGLLLAEGLTNQRVPKLYYILRHVFVKDDVQYVNDAEVTNPKFNVDTEQVWRLMVGVFLLASFIYIDALWWFPWFMGFAIFGAGLSGGCPILSAIRWTGFR